MRTDKRSSQKPDKKLPSRMHKRGIVGYSKKSALLEEAITQMNTGKYGRSSAALKELLALDPQNIEARHLFATLHLRLGSLVTARQAFESLANEAIGRQDYWLAESLLREYLAAGPRCVPFLEQLAQVYQEKGDEMAAVVELGKAIEILRDDPDPDNPQKAAQLYSKIRELAPASSVAFQLASLFDVQTGELLIPPTTPSTPPAEDFTPSADAVMSPADGPAQAVEHTLPEVMPWEVSEESAAAQETQTDVPEVPAPPASEEIPVLKSAVDEATFSYKMSEPVPSDASSDEAIQGVAMSEMPSETPHGISSPMPWEQMADASVQIPEPETPPTPEAFSALESVLASLRTEDKPVASSPAIEETPPEAPAASAHVAEPTPLETGQTESASLSAPMPWEQISDPAIQISVTEAAPTPPPQEFESNVSAAAPDISGSLAVSDAASSPQSVAETTEAPPMEPTHSTEPSAASAGEIPSATSFSWNSVFDKAWKVTAGTMAPSPTVPSDPGLEATDEPQVVEAQAVESSLVEPPAVASPSSQEDLVAPVAPETPVSFSPNASEQVPQEVVSATSVECSTRACRAISTTRDPCSLEHRRSGGSGSPALQEEKTVGKRVGRCCTGGGTAIGG